MQFINLLNYKKITITLLFSLLLFSPAFAEENINEIDNLRAELSFMKDKNSPNYIKAKQKLNKFIQKNNINYSNEARYNDIQGLLEEKKYDSAIYELNELIENSYEISKCNEILGDISVIYAKSPKKIAQYYKIALQHDNNNVSANLKLIKLYIQEKRNILAIEHLRQIIETTQNSELLSYTENLIKNSIKPQNKYEANNLYELLGNIYEKNNDIENAYITYSKAIQLNSSDIYLKYHLANLFFQNNKNEDAIELYSLILNDNPQDYQIKNSIAKSFIKKGNLLSANKNYQEILKRFPNSPQAKYGVYKIFERKLSPNEILSKIYFDNSNYIPTKEDLLSFADFLESMQDYEGANSFKICANNLKEETKEAVIEEKSKEIIKKEKPTEKKEQEVINKKAKKEKNKKEEISKTTKKEPQKPEKEIKAKKEKEEQKKTIISKKEKETPKNKKDENLYSIIDEYMKIEPKTALTYIGISNTYKQMGENSKALSALEEAKKLDPTNSDIYYSIGLIMFENNKTQDAKINLTKAINLNTQNTKAKNLLTFVNQRIITQAINSAYSKYEEKKYVDAFEILENALKEYPQNAQLYYYRALIFSAMNRNAAAIYDLEKSIEFDPGYYMAYYELGKTYEKINDERNALTAYERFLSIEPEEKELIDEIQKKVINLGKKYY